MSDPVNSEIVKYIIQTLVDKLGRRTSQSFAIIVIEKVIRELQPTYDFLHYITVENTSYSEGLKAVDVHTDINAVDTLLVYKAMNDCIKHTAKHLEKNEDFFFIKEIQDAIKEIDGLVLNADNLHLSDIQFEHLAEKKLSLKIKNSEVIEQVLKALIFVLNRKFNEAQAIQKVAVVVKNLRKTNKVLQYVEISETPDSDGFYTIQALPDIDSVLIAEMSEGLQKLIELVGRSVDWEDNQTFVDTFSKELPEEILDALKRMGLTLTSIQLIFLRQVHEQVVKKALDVLVQVVGQRTSTNFALTTLCNVVHDLQEKHEVLHYINVDTIQHEGAVEMIHVQPEINTVESFKLGQAIRDVIKTIGKNLGDKTFAFIEDYKNQLGEDYLSEIEKIGVNLHFLEMKFQ